MHYIIIIIISSDYPHTHTHTSTHIHIVSFIYENIGGERGLYLKQKFKGTYEHRNEH